MFLQVWWPI